jgi:hypothetical protein
MRPRLRPKAQREERMSHTLIILCAIGAGVFIMVIWFMITILQIYHLRKKLPPRPPFKCPKCGSDEIEALLSGLWDGWDDAAGTHLGGIFEYGTCKQCQSRCARHFDDQCYVPSDAEWDGEFKPLERMRKEVENWPFAPDDDFYIRKARLKCQPPVEVSQLDL